MAVRAGSVAYGLIVFGKVRIPASKGGYFFVRWFVGGEDVDGDGDLEKEVKFHSIYTEEKEDGKGGKRFRAIMGEDDVSSYPFFCVWISLILIVCVGAFLL